MKEEVEKEFQRYRALQLYSNAVPGLWGLLFAALFCFDALQYRLFLHSWSTALERFLLPAGLAGLCFLVTRLSLETRIAVANMLVAVIVSLYAGELFLAHRLEVFQRRVAQASGEAFRLVRSRPRRSWSLCASGALTWPSTPAWPS